MKMSVKQSSVVLAAVLSTFGIANMARASIAYDLQALSVTGTGLTLNNAHSVTVTATGGTINFGVFAVVNNGGAPAANDGMTNPGRFYIAPGLASGSGSVAGNNGPVGNLTAGALDSRFTGNSSVSPAGGGGSNSPPAQTAAVDLNGNSFTDYGNLTNDANLDIIPRALAEVLNSNNGTFGSSFLFFTFSMPITSLGTAGGTTIVSAVNNTTTGSILYREAGTAKTSANVSFGTSLSTTITAAGGVTATHSGLGSAATNTLTTPGSITITTTPSGYASAGVQITPVATGSIALSDIGAGLVEVLVHSSMTLTAMGSSVDFPGGTATDLTLPGLDADATNLLSYYPWANILIRYPATTATGNDFFNFDVSGAGATLDRIVAVPEPASLGLLTIGGLALLARRRKVAK